MQPTCMLHFFFELGIDRPNKAYEIRKRTGRKTKY